MKFERIFLQSGGERRIWNRKKLHLAKDDQYLGIRGQSANIQALQTILCVGLGGGG